MAAAAPGAAPAGTPAEVVAANPAPPELSKPVAILSKFAFLDPLQLPLGLAALVLGILHLTLGGLSLI